MSADGHDLQVTQFTVTQKLALLDNDLPEQKLAAARLFLFETLREKYSNELRGLVDALDVVSTEDVAVRKSDKTFEMIENLIKKISANLEDSDGLDDNEKNQIETYLKSLYSQKNPEDLKLFLRLQSGPIGIMAVLADTLVITKGFLLLVACLAFFALTVSFGWAVLPHGFLYFAASCNAFIIGNLLNHGLNNLAETGLGIKNLWEKAGTVVVLSTLLATVAFGFINWMLLYGPTLEMLTALFGVNAFLPAAIMTLIPALLFTAVFYSAAITTPINRLEKQTSFKSSGIKFLSLVLAVSIGISAGLSTLFLMQMYSQVAGAALIAAPIIAALVATGIMYKVIRHNLAKSLNVKMEKALPNTYAQDQESQDYYLLIAKKSDKEDSIKSAPTKEDAIEAPTRIFIDESGLYRWIETKEYKYDENVVIPIPLNKQIDISPLS